MSPKDKQLKKLRTDLEFSGNNEDNNFGYNANNKNNGNKEEMDDAIEFMKEEMLAMKSTYENQIQKMGRTLFLFHLNLIQREILQI